LKKKLQERSPFIMTMREMKNMDMKSNGMFLMILQGFSILALIIGICGVFNNFIISFIERQRSLAVYRSVGMSRQQIIKMIFIESLTGGLIGGIIGVCAGMLEITVVPHLLKALGFPIPIHYSFPIMIYSILGGVLITVISSISPAFKSSRLNIIEAIKYE
jgi:putative ABC transport system permease protein